MKLWRFPLSELPLPSNHTVTVTSTRDFLSVMPINLTIAIYTNRFNRMTGHPDRQGVLQPNSPLRNSLLIRLSSSYIVRLQFYALCGVCKQIVTPSCQDHVWPFALLCCTIHMGNRNIYVHTYNQHSLSLLFSVLYFCWCKSMNEAARPP